VLACGDKLIVLLLLSHSLSPPEVIEKEEGEGEGERERLSDNG
jgi:hypothetical protein